MPPAPLPRSEKSRRTTDSPISYFIQKAIETPGLISFAAGLVDESLATLENAMRLFPRNVPVTIRYAETLMRAGNPRRAHVVLLDLFNNVAPTAEQARLTAIAANAAGDIAEYDSVVHGTRVRIEHWDVAENQGRTAALNMLGRDQPHDVIPYFFSDLADWTWMEYVGPAYGWTEEIVRGSIDDGEFTLFYLDGDRLAAALTVGRSDDLERARELIASGEPVDRAELASA